MTSRAVYTQHSDRPAHGGTHSHTRDRARPTGQRAPSTVTDRRVRARLPTCEGTSGQPGNVRLARWPIDTRPQKKIPQRTREKDPTEDTRKRSLRGQTTREKRHKLNPPQGRPVRMRLSRLGVHIHQLHFLRNVFSICDVCVYVHAWVIGSVKLPMQIGYKM